MQKNKKNNLLIVLMFTIVLDFMSFLLVFPLFPGLFLTKTSVLIAASTSSHVRYIYYALALAAWPLGCFFGTAYLGQLSDKIGRKKVLSLGLFMVSLMYLFQAVSIEAGAVSLFIAARLLQGFFGGNYDIAQAAVADISLPENKARNMGLIALAGSIGIVFGPLLSAFTTSTNLVSWFTTTTPFWFAASLSMANLLWVIFVFKDTFKPKRREPIKFSKVFTSFLFIFSDKRVVRLGVVLFLLSVAWGFYVQQIPIVLQKLFHFSAHTLGYFFIVLGLGFALAMQYIQPAFIKFFSLKNLYVSLMIVVAIIMTIAGLFPFVTVEWVTVFIIAVCHVSGYGCLLALLSNAVSAEEQGKVMGGAGAISCLGFALTSLSLAGLSIISIVLPIFLAAVAYLLSGITLWPKKT